ncbi:MAG: GIY-YIG nuclease family protein [Burkholderiales bacterium]|nr:GIY-YIG nuclease family protein [Burkholderiales bacterium]
MSKQPAVYLMAIKPYGTLYLGVTSNLPQRTWQHKNDLVEGFSKLHKTHDLVWYEMHESMVSAITRGKQIKKWNRDWKVNLIQKENPHWRDLYLDLTA